jgi:clumping factor B
MVAKRSTVAVLLSVIMIMSAGCTGWEFSVYEEEETDGNGETQTQEDPADDDQETTVDDPETDQEMADDGNDSGDPPEESKNENEEIENGPDTVPADETDDAPDLDDSDDPTQNTDDASEAETEEDNPSDTDGTGSEESTDETSKTWEGDEERLTCDAFDTQDDAQAYFDENPEERGHLDQNNNGVPCESLPSDTKGGDNGDEGDTGNNGDGEVYPASLRG